MKGKLALGLLTITCIGLGGTLYTRSAYDDYSDRSLALLKAQYGNQISVSVDRINDGLLDRNERYTFDIAIPELGESMRFITNQQVSFYPGYISADFDFELEGEEWQKIKSRITPLQQPTGIWSASAITNQGDYQFNVEQFELNGNDDESMLVRPLAIDGTFTLDLSEQSTAVLFKGFELHTDDQQIVLGEIKMAAKLELINQVYDVINSQTFLNKLTVDTNEENIVVVGASLISENQHQDGKTKLISKASLESLDLNSADYKINLSDNTVDTTLANLPTDAYVALLALSNRQDADMNSVMAALDNLISKGLQFSLTNFSGDIDAQFDDQSLKGNYQSAGSIVLEATQISELQGPHAIEQLTAKFGVSVSNSLVDGLPDDSKQQIDMFKQQGYLTVKGDKLTSNLELSQGNLTLNGQPLQL